MNETSEETDFDSTPLLIDTTLTLENYINDKGKKKRKQRNRSAKGNHDLPKRYVFAVLAFIGLASAHSMRNNLSVVLLAMVNNTNELSINDTKKVAECPELIENITLGLLKVVHADQYNWTEEVANKILGSFFYGYVLTEIPGGYLAEQISGKLLFGGGVFITALLTAITPLAADQYNWTEEVANKILGSFFYGYVLTEIPGGYLAEQISGKWLFGGGVFITALLTAVTPLAVRFGVYALMTTRILEGLAEGVTHSSMNSMISRWSTKYERSRFSSFIFSGSVLGNVFTFSVSAWLSNSRIFGGWPSAFYIFGALSVLWFIFWSRFVYDYPLEHPSISENELLYFEENQETLHKNPKVPWKDIFTSLSMWAVIVCHFGSSLGFLTLFTALPSYFNEVLHFNIVMDGNITALLFLCEAIGAWIAAYVADTLRESDELSITVIRKIFNTIGTVGPAVLLFCVTLSGCRPQLIVTFICIAMSLHGFSFSGFQVTHIDMSPDFAGVLFGISSAIADLNGIIGPALVTHFTYNETGIGIWNSVFYVICLGYSVAAIVYLLFASAELQPWGLDKKAISVKESLSQEVNIPMKEMKSISEKRRSF